MSRVVNFASTKGRGYNQDLVVTKGILEQIPEVEFNYFTRKVKDKNPVISQKISEAWKDFCRESRNLVVFDSSVPTKLSGLPESRRWLLLGSSFDWQFKLALEKESGANFKKRNSFRKCNFVLPGSPFSKRVLESCCNWEDNTTWLDGDLPFTWYSGQEQTRAKVREKLDFWLPGAKEKKVLAVVLEGEKQGDGFEGFRVGSLLEGLGEDWIVLTNCWDLVKATEGEKVKGLLFTKGRFLNSELVALADTMVTNISKIATTFAGTGKPVWVLDWAPKHFTKWVQIHYPEIYLESADRMVGLESSEAHHRFSKEFTWGKDPSTGLLRLFS